MTSADFYIGSGPDAEYLGSVEIDGDRITMEQAGMFDRPSREKYGEDTYRSVVASVLADAIADETGWKGSWEWMHESSHFTDMAYVYSKGAVSVFTQGKDENGTSGLTLVGVHYPNGGRALGKFPTFEVSREITE